MSKPRLLIAEDSESLLKLISILLKSKGYEVRGVSNGQEALNALAEEKPDLVLLDGMMPLVDGFEVCRHIKSDPLTQNTPVIMLTANKTPAAIALGKEVGADCYITKPFKSSLVIDMIQRFLDPCLDHLQNSSLQDQKLSWSA